MRKRLGHQRLGQGRLADPGQPADEDRLTLAGDRADEPGAEGDLPIAPDQGRGCEERHRGLISHREPRDVGNGMGSAECVAHRSARSIHYPEGPPQPGISTFTTARSRTSAENHRVHTDRRAECPDSASVLPALDAHRRELVSS
jgi:hypothetical protein